MEKIRKNIILLLMLGILFTSVGIVFGAEGSPRLSTTGTIAYTADPPLPDPTPAVTALGGITWNATTGKEGFNISTAVGFSYIASDVYVTLGSPDGNKISQLYLITNAAECSPDKLQALIDSSAAKKISGEKTYNITANIAYNAAGVYSGFTDTLPSITAGGKVDGKMSNGESCTLTGFPIRQITTSSTKVSALFNNNAGTIQNIKVVNPTFTAGYYYIGVACYSNSGTIANIETSSSVTFSGITHFGGIVYSSTGTINSCTNKINAISSNSYASYEVGGIVAQAGGIISNCTNSGTLTSNYYIYGTLYGIVGGIVGEARSTLKSTLEVYGCNNSGKITADIYGGGIIGYSDNSLTITTCYNYATISGDYGGGIVGYGGNIATITDCHNEINATVTGGTDGGGIVGYGNNLTITNCHNYAKILGLGYADLRFLPGGAGGIVGGSDNEFNINDCTNNGSINPNDPIYPNNAGGFVSGGIIGYAFNGGGTINNCTNNGRVYAYYYAGGIIGQIYATMCFEINSCKSTAKLFCDKWDCEKTSIGGVAGYIIYEETFTIQYCEVAGEILYFLSNKWTTLINIGELVGLIEEGDSAYGYYDITNNSANYVITCLGSV